MSEAKEIVLSKVVHVLVQDIVVGKPRDGDDRIDWLIQYSRFEEALTILEADSSLRASSHQKVPLLCVYLH